MTNTEITGLEAAINYASGLSAYCVHTFDQVSAMVPTSDEAAASCEKAQADLAAGGVTGQALTDVASVQEQMTTAVAEINTALTQLEAAGAAATSLQSELESHRGVKDAYNATPDAGDKEFVTGADGTLNAEPQPTPGNTGMDDTEPTVTYTTPEVPRNDLADYRPGRGLDSVEDLIEDLKENWLAAEVTPIESETGVKFEVTGLRRNLEGLAELYGETLPAAAAEPETTSAAATAAAQPEPAQASEPEPAPAPAEPITGELSDKPLLENTWGEFGREGAAHFHTDGPVGTAIEFMGADRMLSVDGEPLANVLARVATDVVRGRSTAQEGVDTLKALRDRLPEGGRARYYVNRAVEDMDGPSSPLPTVPEGTPQPLRDLVAALHAVPLVRKEPDKELSPLLKIVNDFAEGEIPGSGLRWRVEELRNHRHESLGDAGKFEIDRAVRAAAEALEAMPRGALTPPKKRRKR